MKLYMHTLDGYAAQYHPGEQICYAGHFVKRFAKSLKQIREERRLSSEYRGKQGFSDHGIFYGYKILVIKR